MEYFNFSHLPLLVKEMIADEIVHNSIPEDRIQFATTCKAFNQLVKHAKPKKIIRELELHGYFTDVAVFINPGNERRKTLPELKKILQQCQVENLSLYGMDRFIDEHLFPELMDLLTEPCRFLTALEIHSFCSEIKFVDFYKKLRHLKSLTIFHSPEMIMNLPHFPPKLVLQTEHSLPSLAEKTLNRPLSFLEITKEVTIRDIQKFLMTANLKIGAKIHFCFKNEFKKFKGFLTFIGNGLFEFQTCQSLSDRCHHFIVGQLDEFECLTLDQQMNSQNQKILILSADFCLNCIKKIPFTVASVSNPDSVVSSGEFTPYSRGIVFENVAECVKVLNPRHSTYYSFQLLDNWFPRTENQDPFDRVETINKTLGTNIFVIEPEMLEKTTKSHVLAEFHVEIIKLNRF